MRRGETATPRNVCAVRAVLALSILACVFILGCAQAAEYRLYDEGESVSLGSDVSLIVPSGLEASYSSVGNSSTFGNPYVILSGQVAQDESTSTGDMVIVGVGTAESLATWEQHDAAIRSRDETGVFPAAYETLELEKGWVASITTRNEARSGRPPAVVMIASVSHPKMPPVRIHAFYSEAASMPAVPPDPANELRKTRTLIQLALP